MLFLWIAACLAVLVIGLGFLDGASALFVEKWMLYLTFPVGVPVAIVWSFLGTALPKALAACFYGRTGATALWLLFVALGYWQWFQALPWLLAKVHLRPFSKPAERIGRVDVFSCACFALAALSGMAFWLMGLWSRIPGGSPTLQWQAGYVSFLAAAAGLATGVTGIVISVRRAQAIGFSMSVVGSIVSGFIVLVWFALASMGGMH
jgi:hypothetical protein